MLFKEREAMKDYITMALTALIIVFVIYSIYWIGKVGSYKIFYESMVKQTVTQMVKSESLR